MKRRIQFGRLAAVAAVLFAMLPVAASAQMFGQQTPSWRGVWNPVVGTGGTYELTQKDGTKMQMEMAIVGKETVNGKDGYWFELTMDNEKMGGTMIIKNLTVRDNQNMMSQRVIMQMPNRPPMEMPERMIQMRQQNQTQPADIREQAEVVGPESLTTPAGTFATIHYRMKDGSGDVWVAEHAGPYGMVKFQGKDSSMVLIKVESDAKDKITQTPVPFSPAAFGQR
jgi:hypothetical protein